MQVFTYYRVFSFGREVKQGDLANIQMVQFSICSIVCDCHYVKYMITLVWGCT